MVPFPRMTARRWLVAVAVVAVLSGITVEIAREIELSSEYRRRAADHGLLESGSRGDVLHGPGGMYAQMIGPRDPSKAGYHAMMREKYGRAARCPWLPVPPDPPPPE